MGFRRPNIRLGPSGAPPDQEFGKALIPAASHGPPAGFLLQCCPMSVASARSNLLIFLIFGVSSLHGQSLEDKVSEARRLQAQSLTGLDETSIDSLSRDKQVLEAKKRGRLGLPPRAGKQAADAPMLDSLIAGPTGWETGEDTALVDSSGNPLPDSLAPGTRKKKERLPKRYEQRIFQSVDRSAFNSAQGAAGRNHILGPGDEVIVSLWGDKEREYDLILNPEGKIFLEGVGLLPLAGSDLDDAQAKLKQRLARIYSGISRGTTHVDVALGKVGPLRVFVLGEVKVPGGYVFTGNAGILSAMYFAKGPTDIGTVRNLQLTRGGKKYAIDLYAYLIHGQSPTPEVLQDGDVLFAGRADALVDIQGDVGRPATYELKKGEGVKEVIEYAGGLNPTAAAHRLVLQRVFPGGKLDYMDLASPQDYLEGKAKMELKSGDRLMVYKSTEQPRDFLTVTGPVRYPGTYAFEGIRNVTDLIARAGGLREEIFLGRAHVLRFHPDGSSDLFAYSLDTTRSDSINLQPRDNVILYSIKDMYLPDSVEVAGAVFKPGKYEFHRGMTAKDLVMQAGGFLPHHEPGRLLVFREGQRDRKVDQIAIATKDGLAKVQESMTLQPGDFVQVPVNPNWYKTEVVTLEGLFLHPGKYGLLFPGEKLASVIERAGGFRDNAYVAGGRFFRSRDSVGRVGVDIMRAMESQRSKANIALVGGDSIFVPERSNTVKVVGEVGFETSVLFKSGASALYYIEKAGGFTRRSEKDRVVVQYANGETSRDGYFNRKPDAGSVIYVPQGPEPKPIEWFTGINAILGTLGVAAAVILSIQAISK
jgi:polysaccharide biosynthesis/export protein